MLEEKSSSRGKSSNMTNKPFLHKRLYSDPISGVIHRVRYHIERFFDDRIPIILVRVVDSLEKTRMKGEGWWWSMDKPNRSSMVGIPEPFLIVTFFVVLVAEPGWLVSVFARGIGHKINGVNNSVIGRHSSRECHGNVWEWIIEKKN